MATTITVPGAESTYVPNTYNTPYNTAVAQQISNMLAESQSNGTLFVQNSDLNPGPVPAGFTGEVVDTVPGGGVVDVPPGYTYTAIDQSVTGPVTVMSGGSLFAGNQTLTYYGAAASSPVYIAAGDGNDLIGLAPGSTYQVGLGNGNDTVYANGSGTVTGGSGDNLFFADSAGGQNLVNSYGASDTIVAGQGSVSVATYGANPLVDGGSGQLVYIGSAGVAGNPTITGGTGQETLFGGAGQNITYTDGSNTTTGANIMAAGSGNETLNAGGAKYGVQMAVGSGSVDMIGSTGNDTFFGGSGTATITGNGGSDQLVVGTVPGHTGGTDIFTDFNSNDLFVVCGYGANAAQNALNAATVAGGNTTVKLSDNTTITFLGITNPGTINNISY
jgi:Ca2+-binding RTX toxin-like protein